MFAFSATAILRENVVPVKQKFQSVTRTHFTEHVVVGCLSVKREVDQNSKWLISGYRSARSGGHLHLQLGFEGGGTKERDPRHGRSDRRRRCRRRRMSKIWFGEKTFVFGFEFGFCFTLTKSFVILIFINMNYNSDSQPGVRVPLGARRILKPLILLCLGVRKYQKFEKAWFTVF